MDLKTIEDLQLRIEREHPTEDDWTYMRNVVGNMRDEFKRREQLTEAVKDYPGLEHFVREQCLQDPLIEQEAMFWSRLGRTIDDLNRGMTDTMEAFSEWNEKHDKRGADLLVVFLAATRWKDKLADDLQHPLPSLNNYERLRITREAMDLNQSLAAVYPEVSGL